MHSVFIMLIYFLPYITTQNSTVLYSKYRWLQLPATPKLSPYPIGQYAEINNILIWYTIYGSDNAIPLLFLHGGFANSDYWGLQVGELKSLYRCILMDSRGQGRSFTSSTNITYDLMTSDVIALLDYLNIERVHVVGWSDGGIIGLNLAMNYQNRLISLFAFGASYVPTGAKDIFTSPVFMAYIERTKVEYEAMNPVNDYSSLYNNLTSMWAILPNWTQQDFERIDKNLPIWIVDGDHEEAIFRSQPDDMTSWIPQAGELILPGTGHFAFIQDPVVFTAFVKHFDQYIFISDTDNHRVIKSINAASEGTVVAGGQGKGNDLTQLSYPQAVIADSSGIIYVADEENHRVMRWFRGATQGTMIAGGNGKGIQMNQLNHPAGLSFDGHGNLYVADFYNHRIQHFDIETN
ncbi:unnamed protein product [Rotaria sp. Silwood2]|nr:unnamed protein product [Rotaria sp. Silwood2]